MHVNIFIVLCCLNLIIIYTIYWKAFFLSLFIENERNVYCIDIKNNLPPFPFPFIETPFTSKVAKKKINTLHFWHLSSSVMMQYHYHRNIDLDHAGIIYLIRGCRRFWHKCCFLLTWLRLQHQFRYKSFIVSKKVFTTYLQNLFRNV